MCRLAYLLMVPEALKCLDSDNGVARNKKGPALHYLFHSLDLLFNKFKILFG